VGPKKNLIIETEEDDEAQEEKSPQQQLPEIEEASPQNLYLEEDEDFMIPPPKR